MVAKKNEFGQPTPKHAHDIISILLYVAKVKTSITLNSQSSKA